MMQTAIAKWVNAILSVRGFLLVGAVTISLTFFEWTEKNKIKYLFA
jgi:hypothetical protein